MSVRVRRADSIQIAEPPIQFLPDSYPHSATPYAAWDFSLNDQNFSTAKTKFSKDSLRSSCINDWLYSDFAWFFDLLLDVIAEDIIGVIQDGGMAKLKEYLEDYPNFAQAKVLGLLWALLDTEFTFMSEQLKT